MLKNQGRMNRYTKIATKFFSISFTLLLFSKIALAQEDHDLIFQHMQDSVSTLWKDTSLYFPHKDFVKVIGYTYNEGLNEGNAEYFTIYDARKKKFAKTINPVHTVLTKSQTDTLLSILNDTVAFTWGQAGCYMPHHAFVFYDAKEKPVALIDICFMCDQTVSWPRTPIMRWGGLSEDGRIRLYEFCKFVGMNMKVSDEDLLPEEK